MEHDLIIDYDVFEKNIDVYKLLSRVPVEKFFDLLSQINSEEYNQEILLRHERRSKVLKRISTISQKYCFSKSEIEKWCCYRESMSLIMIASLLYADKNPYKFQISGNIDRLTKNLFFFPHYDSYMSIIPILASNSIDVTVLMDENYIDLWDKVLGELNLNGRIHLYGIQSQKFLQKALSRVESGSNLLMFPDFSLGNESKKHTLYGELLGMKAKIPLGPARIAKYLDLDLIPLKMVYPQHQLLPCIFFDTKIKKRSTELMAIDMMKSMDGIISDDLTKWWGWEVYDLIFS